MAGEYNIRNVSLGWSAITHLKNWPTYFLDFFNITGKKHIVYQARNGLKYLARARTSDRGIITTVAIQDEYELAKLGYNDATIIDLGGQNGYFSTFASQFAKHIYTFEPIPQNYKIIQQNIKLNNLQDSIKVQNVAVSDKKSKLKIFLSPNTGGHSINGKGKFIEVPTVSLKQIIDKNKIKHVHFLKIDVEGSEYKILYNLPKSYYKRIDNIRMEVHEVDDKKQNSKALVKFFRENGYKVRVTYPLIFAQRKK